MKTQLGITLQNLVDQMFHFLRGEGVKVPILGGELTHTLLQNNQTNKTKIILAL